MPNKKSITPKGRKRSTAVTPKTVKLHTSHSMRLASLSNQPVVTRGEAGNERHYYANHDGSIEVPAAEVEDFIAMGCSREPQEPVQISNVAPES